MKRATIALHIQPKKMQFMELLRPFIPEKLGAQEQTPIQTMAVVAKWENRKITLDGSGTLADGIFMKLERTFAVDFPFSEITNRLRLDALEILKMLGVEEDLR